MTLVYVHWTNGPSEETTPSLRLQTFALERGKNVEQRGESRHLRKSRLSPSGQRIDRMFSGVRIRSIGTRRFHRDQPEEKRLSRRWTTREHSTYGEVARSDCWLVVDVTRLQFSFSKGRFFVWGESEKLKAHSVSTETLVDATDFVGIDFERRNCLRIPIAGGLSCLEWNWLLGERTFWMQVKCWELLGRRWTFCSSTKRTVGKRETNTNCDGLGNLNRRRRRVEVQGGEELTWRDANDTPRMKGHSGQWREPEVGQRQLGVACVARALRDEGRI